MVSSSHLAPYIRHSLRLGAAVVVPSSRLCFAVSCAILTSHVAALRVLCVGLSGAVVTVTALQLCTPPDRILGDPFTE
jgi:hypothetical protein